MKELIILWWKFLFSFLFAGRCFERTNPYCILTTQSPLKTNNYSSLLTEASLFVPRKKILPCFLCSLRVKGMHTEKALDSNTSFLMMMFFYSHPFEHTLPLWKLRIVEWRRKRNQILAASFHLLENLWKM